MCKMTSGWKGICRAEVLWPRVPESSTNLVRLFEEWPMIIMKYLGLSSSSGDELVLGNEMLQSKHQLYEPPGSNEGASGWTPNFHITASSSLLVSKHHFLPWAPY